MEASLSLTRTVDRYFKNFHTIILSHAFSMFHFLNSESKSDRCLWYSVIYDQCTIIYDWSFRSRNAYSKMTWINLILFVDQILEEPNWQKWEGSLQPLISMEDVMYTYLTIKSNSAPHNMMTPNKVEMAPWITGANICSIVIFIRRLRLPIHVK